MNPMLQQFLSESRVFSQGIAEELMRLEEAPGDGDAASELYRFFHTLKGMSDLFRFAELTGVLCAGEDLAGLLRSGEVSYSRELADRLLHAMVCVLAMCRDIESVEKIDGSRAMEAPSMAGALRALMPIPEPLVTRGAGAAGQISDGPSLPTSLSPGQPDFAAIRTVPEATRREAWLLSREGDPIHWIDYRPHRQCFLRGDDPFQTARRTPGLLWGRVHATEPLARLAELDACRCVLRFQLLVAAPAERLAAHYRSMAGLISVVSIAPGWLGRFADPRESREHLFSADLAARRTDARAAAEAPAELGIEPLDESRSEGIFGNGAIEES